MCDLKIKNRISDSVCIKGGYIIAYLDGTRRSCWTCGGRRSELEERQIADPTELERGFRKATTDRTGDDDRATSGGDGGGDLLWVCKFVTLF